MVYAEDPMENHPVVEAFVQQYACSRDKADLALRVYLNLAEVRGWRDVRMHFCEKLQMPFVTGRATMGSEVEAAVPMAMEDSMSHQQIQALFSALRIDDQQFDRIMLAICASDTSIVYYKVTTGIVKPEPPEASDARKQDWQKKAAKRRLHIAECIENFSQQQESDLP